MFWWWVVCSFTISTCFQLRLISIFLQLNNYSPITRSAETQPTDWSFAFRSHCRHANDNKHQAVCFCGEFLMSSPFLPLFLATSQFFFTIKFLWSHHAISRSSAHRLKFGLPPSFADMPTTIGIGWYVLMVSFWVLHLFYHYFLNDSQLFFYN